MDKWEKGAAEAAGAMLAAWELGAVGQRAKVVETTVGSSLTPAAARLLDRFAAEGETARRIVVEAIVRMAAYGGIVSRERDASKEAML